MMFRLDFFQYTLGQDPDSLIGLLDVGRQREKERQPLGKSIKVFKPFRLNFETS